MAGFARQAPDAPAMTFEEIAAELGCTRQNVNQIYAAAIRKLRRDGMADSLELLGELNKKRRYAVPRGPRACV